ncbi:hypothetical protein FOZ61_002471, partial [Perkinsus olseni]
IIDPFRGEKNQDIVEFLAKFGETYNLLGWPAATKYNVLRVNIEGVPFQIVNNNVRVAKDDPTAYSKAKSVLLSSLAEGESSGDYMSELQKLFRQCLPSDFSVPEAERSKLVDFFVCLQFWRGLPSSTPGLMGLRQQWQAELATGQTDMIEHALNLCKAVTADGFTAVSFPAKGKGYAGKGYRAGKGKGSARSRGKGFVSRDISKGYKGGGKGVRCFNCNGRGHVAASCPSQPQSQAAGAAGQTIEKLSDHELRLFHESIQTMISNGYFELVDPSLVKATVTTMPVVSLGRSTPVRVVIDYKFLNDLIESRPNDRNGPVSCPAELRKWRCLDPAEYVTIDIKHAYMQIHMDPVLRYWQCAVFPHLPAAANTFAMTRAGFGLAVSGKALDVTTDHSLSRL